MNKFDHILVEYDGNIEKPNIKFLEKCRSSVEVYKSYLSSCHYRRGYDNYIFLILEEKRNDWIIENRDKQINKLLEK